MTSDTAAGTAPSPDRRVLRGELAQAVGPLSTPQLRTGAWTRFVTGSRPMWRETQIRAATRTRAIMESELDKSCAQT